MKQIIIVLNLHEIKFHTKEQQRMEIYSSVNNGLQGI